jgi:ethanolamine utilization protein EutN
MTNFENTWKNQPGSKSPLEVSNMKLGRVVGTVVPCQRYPGLEGVPLLLVQPLDRCGAAQGHPQVAADATKMAGPGELVLYEGGREAAMALEQTFVPVDQSILGIVDRVDSEEWDSNDSR